MRQKILLKSNGYVVFRAFLNPETLVITSKPSLEFLGYMIFWDEKMPITTDILRRLSLKFVANELGLSEQYLLWAGMNQDISTGQLLLGIAEHQPRYKV